MPWALQVSNLGKRRPRAKPTRESFTPQPCEKDSQEHAFEQPLRLKKITRPSTTLEERIPTPVMIMMKGTLHQLAQGKVISYEKNNTDKTWSSVSNSSLSKTFALCPLEGLKFRSFVFSLQTSFSLNFIFWSLFKVPPCLLPPSSRPPEKGCNL